MKLVFVTKKSMMLMGDNYDDEAVVIIIKFKFQLRLKQGNDSYIVRYLHGRKLHKLKAQ
jgi:hypothetical protein